MAVPTRFSSNDVTRYRFYVLLSSKYLLDDQVDYSLVVKKPNLEFAKAALELGSEIQRQKDLLPEAQQRFFAPSIAGSVADSYLRLAKIKESDRVETDKLVSAAVDQLRMALRSSDASTVQWAFFRLADIELGRANAGAALEWLVRAFNNFPAFPKAFDESYFPFGMLIEKPTSAVRRLKYSTRVPQPEVARANCSLLTHCDGKAIYAELWRSWTPYKRRWSRRRGGWVTLFGKSFRWSTQSLSRRA
jgi:hypothetical protein